MNNIQQDGVTKIRIIGRKLISSASIPILLYRVLVPCSLVDVCDSKTLE